MGEGARKRWKLEVVAVVIIGVLGAIVVVNELLERRFAGEELLERELVRFAEGKTDVRVFIGARFIGSSGQWKFAALGMWMVRSSSKGR